MLSAPVFLYPCYASLAPWDSALLRLLGTKLKPHYHYNVGIQSPAASFATWVWEQCNYRP